MSSHPPMEKLEAGSEPGPPCDLAAGRVVTLAGIGGLCRRAYRRRSQIGCWLVDKEKHVKHISSVPHRRHLSHPGPQTPRRGISKDILNEQYQEHVSAVCAQCVDRVEIRDLTVICPEQPEAY